MDLNQTNQLKNEDGYELWLRYPLIDNANFLQSYCDMIRHICFPTSSPTLIAAYEELTFGIESMLGLSIPIIESIENKTLIVGTAQSQPALASIPLKNELKQIGDEGYLIKRISLDNKDCVIITANTDIGILYGVFAFLRHLQNHQILDNLNILSAPKIQYRMLNHWDNLDRTIERGYAGFSLWDWHKLPDYIDPRYKDYARTNASIGINKVVLNNVNANALILTPMYLAKVAAIAEVFRPYGIQVFLSARFSAPMELSQFATADPLDIGVAQWWHHKVDEIYQYIPDFGGFIIKANSEGQPGPHDYGRIHADGANMLAKALAPHHGVVIWRAFVYDDEVVEDRHRQAYTQLVPQDGTFMDNAVLQVKNGAIDFQPREPFHPLFGAMPKTPLMLELQITQEYLGCATHLVYLAPLFKEVLDADTYCQGEGSTVTKVVDGSLDGHQVSGMAGVANIGNDRNWCGHPFAASNWYAFGRLAWDYDLSSESIADEWLRLSFSNDAKFVEQAKRMMIQSREAVVRYMTPLGLHHIMARNHHFGPGPWVEGGRADWTSLYYHQADSEGVGFDRSATGSDAVSQYFAPYAEQVGKIETCPEELLLWFHHVRWDHIMKSGRTLWDELCYVYNDGVNMVRTMQQTWDSLADYVDLARFRHIKTLLAIQEQEARWWRDACLLYFQTFSMMPIPSEYEQAEHSLEYYRNLTHYYVPGIPERRFGY